MFFEWKQNRVRKIAPYFDFYVAAWCTPLENAVGTFQKTLPLWMRKNLRMNFTQTLEGAI
jgi:hypothetical protein